MRLDTILNHVLLPDGRTAAIGIANGRISAIRPDDGSLEAAGKRLDLDFSLVVPGLVDGHVHLDTTFLGDQWRPHEPCQAGFSVAERLAIQKKWLKAGAPTEARAATLIERAVAAGTTTMRTHIEVDVDLGLSNLECNPEPARPVPHCSLDSNRRPSTRPYSSAWHAGADGRCAAARG